MLDALIIDDDVEIAQGVRDLLEMEGYRALAVRDGRRALATLGALAEMPRCLLLDLNLPLLDGPAVLAALRQAPAWRNIPILIMTAEEAPEAWLRDAAIVAILRKPFHHDELLARFGQTLAARPAA